MTNLNRVYWGGLRRTYRSGVLGPWLRRKKQRISAMLRVKNEARYLAPALESIVGLVHEVVVIDNLSEDQTPQIAAGFAERFPGKVRLHRYPHAVARVGAENRALIESEEGRRSPALLSNYYNWCLARCTGDFILKWDGDMVATEQFAGELAEFQRGPWLVFKFRGANLHPDRLHLVGVPPKNQDAIQEQVTGKFTVGNWTAPFTDYEPRLFPRYQAIYNNAFWWCEALKSPFLDWQELQLKALEPCYVHLKYCKDNPYENFSRDFAEAIGREISRVGPALAPHLARTVARWKL